MDKLIDGTLALAYAAVIAFGGRYAIQQIVCWSQRMAFEKVAHGLGSLESAAQKMTGEKLDF